MRFFAEKNFELLEKRALQGTQKNGKYISV